MTTWRVILAKLRALGRRAAMARELEDEIHEHLALEAAERVAGGVSPDEARYAARRAFGNITLARERSRDAWSFVTLEMILQDVRHGAHLLARTPGFTIAAMLTLALSIGANSTIFSLVDAALLRPLPYPDAGRLVMLWESTPSIPRLPLSGYDFLDWERQSTVWTSMAAIAPPQSFDLVDARGPDRVSGLRVSATFFTLLGVRPLLGRTFAPHDDAPGSAPAVVLSYDFWTHHFGANPAIVSKMIVLDDRSYLVIGVMPRGFTTPVRPAQLWAPLVLDDAEMVMRGKRYLRVLARLRPGIAVARAGDEMRTIASRIAHDYPATNSQVGARIVPLREEIAGGYRRVLLLLWGAASFVLLVACANIAGLLLSRAVARAREIAVRAALGASRARLVRQLLTESTLLALAGGAIGFVIALGGVRLLTVLRPPALEPLSGVGLDARVFLFTLGVSLVAGVLFGLVPAMRGMPTDGTRALTDATTPAPAVPRGHATLGALAAGEIALGLVLLTGAGLLARSLIALQRVEPGFDPRHVLTVRLSLPNARYPQVQQRQLLYRQVLDRLAHQRSILAAGLIDYLPFGGSDYSGPFAIDGGPRWTASEQPIAEWRWVSPDYFRAMGIPLHAGRAFTDHDAADGAPVAIISAAMAQRYFGARNPVGQRIALGFATAPAGWMTIVGVVGDVREGGLDRHPRPEIYQSYAQGGPPFTTLGDVYLTVRTTSATDAALRATRDAVQAIDKELPIYDARPMEQLLSASLAGRRLDLRLIGSFAALAVLLAAVGVYGVTSYSVSRRQHEIAVRIAMGAEPRRVFALVLGQGMRLVLVGEVAGCIAAAALTRIMTALLFGVGAMDLATFAIVALMLAIVALLACALPARRVLRSSPADALRSI